MALALGAIVTLDGLGAFLAGADRRYAGIDDIPTDTADLTNGAGYITDADVARSVAAGVASALANITWADLEGSGT